MITTKGCSWYRQYTTLCYTATWLWIPLWEGGTRCFDGMRRKLLLFLRAYIQNTFPIIRTSVIDTAIWPAIYNSALGAFAEFRSGAYWKHPKNRSPEQAFKNLDPTVLPVACIRNGRTHELIQKPSENQKMFRISRHFRLSDHLSIPFRSHNRGPVVVLSPFYELIDEMPYSILCWYNPFILIFFFFLPAVSSNAFRNL